MSRNNIFEAVFKEIFDYSLAGVTKKVILDMRDLNKVSLRLSLESAYESWSVLLESDIVATPLNLDEVRDRLYHRAILSFMAEFFKVSKPKLGLFKRYRDGVRKD